MSQIISVNPSAIEVAEIGYSTHLKPLVTQLPLRSCEVCVIVPVRNEAEALKTTLLALNNQVDLQGKPLAKNRYEIIVLANNCSDYSAEIARRFAQTHSIVLHIVEMTLNSDRAHIGWVRKLLMDEAYRRLKFIGRNLGIIASTDGDTQVCATWIAATLAEIQNGADAVSGRIVTNSRERSKLDQNTRLYYLRHSRYGYLTSQLEACLDPYFESRPRHHHHYGASMAVTAQMYAEVGGIAPLRSSEDVALYNALKRVDARFRHSPMVKVITSARVIGRAKAGLSDRLSQLKMMAQNHQPVFVESAELMRTRFCLRRQLRYLWQNIQQARYPVELVMGENALPDVCSTPMPIIAQQLGIKADLLAETIMRSPTFGLLVEQIEEYQQDNDQLNCSWQKVTIQKAIADLGNMIKQSDRLEYLSLDALKQIEPISLLAQPL